MATRLEDGAIDPKSAGDQDLAEIFKQGLALYQAQGSANGAGSSSVSIERVLLGTAMDVTGRKGLTGKDYTAASLPPWIRPSVYAQIQNNPSLAADFDPYLGVVSKEGDERVYFGTKSHKDKTGEVRVIQGVDGGAPVVAQHVGKGEVTKKDQTLTVVQAMNMPYQWDQEEVNDTISKMRAAGLDVKTFDDMLNVWGSMVDRAAKTYSLSSGEKKVTPWDVLDMYKREAVAGGGLLPGQLDPNRTEKHVSRSVAELTEGEAWSTLRSTLQQMLGRDPSDEELREYTYRMNSLAAKNPAITKTITKYENGQPVSSNSHTRGGFTGADAAQAAYEDAQSDPDYAEYQSATTYFNAAMSALGPIGG